MHRFVLIVLWCTVSEARDYLRVSRDEADFGAIAAQRRQMILEQLNSTISDIAAPGFEPAAPGYDDVIASSESSTSESSVSDVTDEYDDASSKSSTLETTSEEDPNPTPGELVSSEEITSPIEGCGDNDVIGSLEKISGEVSTKLPCTNDEDLTETTPDNLVEAMRPELSIETSIEEVTRSPGTLPSTLGTYEPTGYTELNPYTILSSIDRTQTESDPSDVPTTIDEFYYSTPIPNQFRVSSFDLEQQSTTPEFVPTFAPNNYESVVASTLFPSTYRAEAVNGDENTIFEEDELHPANWSEPRRGAVDGCPPPKLCAKNCFISINDDGCQDCTCLWISLVCESDSDCPEYAQLCDMGKCQCRPGYEQDMSKSGFCKESISTSAELEEEISGTTRSDRNLQPGNSVQYDDARFRRFTENNWITLTHSTTPVPPSAYFFGRPNRIKREAFTTESFPNKPRQSERLQWPGPCDYQNRCPEGLFCIEGDCWSMPEKPLLSYINEQKNYKRNDYLGGFINKKLQKKQARTSSDRPVDAEVSGNIKRDTASQIEPSPPGYLPQNDDFDYAMDLLETATVPIKIFHPAKKLSSDNEKQFTESAPRFVPRGDRRNLPSFDMAERLQAQNTNSVPQKELPRRFPVLLPDYEQRKAGVWYDVQPGEFPQISTIRRKPANVPKKTDRLFYEYSSANILNKPILVEGNREQVSDECFRDSECSSRTKCCAKKWCDRQNICGNARFCLPECNLTKVVHTGSTNIDIIYD